MKSQHRAIARMGSPATRSQGTRRVTRVMRSPEDRSASERLATELIGVCLAALRAYGVDSAGVLRSRAPLMPAAARATFARRLFHDTFWLGELATEWTENPLYMDQSGRPRVLAIDGEGATFAALVRKYFGPRRLRSVLELAQRTRVIERIGEDRVAQLNACVMLTGQPLLLLARAILCVRGLLAATQSNARGAAKPSELSPDRLACSYVPKESFEEFAGFMRPQLHNVMDQGNRWLSEHTVRDRPRETDNKRGLMGVHAYVFSD